ncbi:MAG TPA: TRCF domain-containing protein, partial [Thermoanaerobaculia bacterium]
FYKKIASATTDVRLDDIRGEMRERFGALPANVESLIHFVKVKHFAQHLGVISIVRDGSRGVIKLTQKARIDPNKLLALIQENPAIKFSPNGVLSFPIQAHGAEVIDTIEQLLGALAG